MILHELFLIAQDVIPVGAARVAAAITLQGMVIAYGVNRRKTHPLQAKYGRNPQSLYLHAEVDVIIRARKRYPTLDNCILWVARAKYNRDNQPVMGLARPCSGCLQLIKKNKYNLKKIVYTIDNNGAGELVPSFY